MVKGLSRSAVLTLGCALLALIVGVASCDKVPLLAPTGSAITLTAPTTMLPLGGTTEITAFVSESSGTPVQNGTTVRFTSTLGTVTPADTQTRNGFATATFTAGNQSGIAQITATSGAIGSGGATPTTVVTTSPTTTPTTSPSTTTIPPTTRATLAATASGSNVLQITIGSANAATVILSASPSRVPSTGGT